MVVKKADSAQTSITWYSLAEQGTPATASFPSPFGLIERHLLHRSIRFWTHPREDLVAGGDWNRPLVNR